MSGRVKATIACLAVAAAVGGVFAASSWTVPQDEPTTEQASGMTLPEELEPGLLEEVAALHDIKFGGIILDIPVADFEAAGFVYGDSVDIGFSNGYRLADVPYYNGYYVEAGDPIVIAYPSADRPRVCINYGPSLWEESGLADGATAYVRLREAGKYKDVQNTLYATYSDNRVDYTSDAVFSNYRQVKGGALKEGLFFRGASPVSDYRNRSGYVNALMARDKIAYDLDLSDSPEEINEYLVVAKRQKADTSYFEGLLSAGKVGTLNLDQSYRSVEYAQSLSHGLYEMAKNEGPYYIHCIEGKDRTGFACMLLEALAGASYEEMLNDYMTTYANYYGITKASDPDRYQTVKTLQADVLISYIGGTNDLANANYSAGARRYLEYGGLTSAQISVIMGAICQ